MGAASVIECLEKHWPNVINTSWVDDAALFLAPKVYELGWNWDVFQLWQGYLAGHLIESGCHHYKKSGHFLTNSFPTKEDGRKR